MDQHEIADLLPPGSLFARHIRVLPSVGSTNDYLKALAGRGAPEGAVILAEEQTAGKGTHGRSFYSPKGTGLYLSLLLRPAAPLNELLTLTGRAAVAAAEGIEAACGAPVRIKWLNDLCLNGRKLVGILAELSPLNTAGQADYVVLGVGVNVSQTAAQFQAQGLGRIATSLAAEGFPVTRPQLAAALLTSLEKMYRAFPAARQDYLDRYRARCLTLGRTVSFQAQGGTYTGAALDLAPDFSLVVRDGNGTVRGLSSGTVAIL